MSVPSTTDGPPTPGRSRRKLGAALAAAVVVAVAVVLALTLPGDGDSGARRAGTSAAAATTSAAGTTGPAAASSSAAPGSPSAAPAAATSTAPTATPASGEPGSADFSPATLAPVPLDAAVTAGDGVVVSLPEVVGVQGTANGPGNVAGPAVRVSVRVENRTGEDLDLGAIATTLTYGADATPASPLDDPAQWPLAGTLADGESATGVYVFTVPADARDAVTVVVGPRADAPLLVFTGAVR
ncbi:hypothetical protein [Modestobacter sp. NPDC049651]|uniref:hypothetical protein n=1 Tax=unclassified Modestobacter TaxID=2643866 RepID=UPI0033C8F6EC